MNARVKLKEYLQAHNISQAELARRSGLTTCMISRIINNNRNGNIIAWLRIRRALDCDIEDIITIGRGDHNGREEK